MLLQPSKQKDSVEAAAAGVIGKSGSIEKGSDGAVHEAGEVSPRVYVQLGVLAISVAVLLFVYRETALAMVGIWNRSDTFAHGYLVAPISLWLMWRNRAALSRVEVKPSVLGMLFGVFAGLAWLLGELASVDAVSQFALVGMLISLMWAVMGTSVARKFAFPMGFLIFLVPFGEFLFPTMMDWTATFVVGALRFFSVPVYVEGRSLVIPTGTWQVVEGCSGVRYLIASVVVGSLYSYLSYRSLPRRVIFTAVSVVLPVLANWLRAWGIVLLGHLSGNRLATGVDHIVYGWVFFGVIMLLLFWAGSRWQQEDVVENGAPHAAALHAGARLTASAAAAWTLVAIVALLAWKPLLGQLTKDARQGAVHFVSITPAAGWGAEAGARLPVWAPSYSGMQGESKSAWAHDGAVVGLYVAYYRNQQPGKELINSENRVLISKDPVWRMTGHDAQSVKLGANPMTMLNTEMVSEAGRLMVWNAYWVDGKWTTNDYLAKLYLALAQLKGGRDDSAAVMIYTPYAEGEPKPATHLLERFVAEMGPQVARMLASTAVSDAREAK